MRRPGENGKHPYGAHHTVCTALCNSTVLCRNTPRTAPDSHAHSNGLTQPLSPSRLQAGHTSLRAPQQQEEHAQPHMTPQCQHTQPWGHSHCSAHPARLQLPTRNPNHGMRAALTDTAVLRAPSAQPWEQPWADPLLSPTHHVPSPALQHPHLVAFLKYDRSIFLHKGLAIGKQRH